MEYPVPVHRQPYVMERGFHAELPITDAAAEGTLSLPMYAGLTHDEEARVVAAVQAAVRRHVREPVRAPGRIPVRSCRLAMTAAGPVPGRLRVAIVAANTFE